MNKLLEAYRFYQRHILDSEKISLLENYHLPVAGSVPSVLWELLGCLVTGKTGAGTTGADLQGWEVKSAKARGSFEYQYHLNTGLSKLHEDCEVNHLFFSYSETYKDVVVRAMRGQDLALPYFQEWIPKYNMNYDPNAPRNQRRQRFRKSIPYGYVQNNGALVLRIKDGILLEHHENVINELNQ